MAPGGIVAQVDEVVYEAEHALLANVVRGPSTVPEGNWYHCRQNDYRYRSEIKSKRIGLYQITDITDL